MSDPLGPFFYGVFWPKVLTMKNRIEIVTCEMYDRRHIYFFNRTQSRCVFLGLNPYNFPTNCSKFCLHLNLKVI
ncbi:hypothetical protein EV673_0007 [Limnobacter thiooxidans]|nr:hypothetical protein EV673_0007 [Limnobacter thiooxidans]